MENIPVSCNLDCGGGCALMATIENGRVTGIRDNPIRPVDAVGCARGHHAHEGLYASHRVLTPRIRTGPRGSGEFREAGWDEALDLVSDRIGRLRDRYGAESILALAGAGACRGAVHNTSALTRRFFSCVADGYTGTYSGYSSAAQSFVLPFLFGRSDVGYDPATLDESRLVLLWGANVSDTRFGSDMETVLRRIHQRGTPIIAIDPRKSRTVRTLADEWIPINPGTDSALMCALLYVMIDEDLIDRRFLDRYTTGFALLEASILGTDTTGASPPGCNVAQTPEWAERITGVPAVKIAEIARRYAAARPAALVSGLSIQRAVGGEEAVRLAVSLQAATGNIGVPGGATGCCPWGHLPGPRFGRIPATARDRTGPSRSILIYRWPDAILGDEGFRRESDDGGADITSSRGADEPIRAVYIVGANYVVTGSDIVKNRRAFEALEFSVCHEHTLTPTAMHCDVVLPATTYLEREDVVSAAGNYLHYSAKACDPLGSSKNDYDIFSELSRRFGVERLFSEGRTPETWLEYLAASSGIKDFDTFRQTGTYDGGDHRRVGLADFHADPVAHALPTPSGRIELASTAYAENGGPVVPCYRGQHTITDSDATFPLKMITPHARNRTNSQNATMEWAIRSEPQRLLMNHVDAESRKIVDGSEVIVENEIGRISVQVEVRNDIKRGVVSLLAGMWPGELDSDATGDFYTGGAANILTSTEPTLPSRGSRTHTNAVEVRPVATD